MGEALWLWATSNPILSGAALGLLAVLFWVCINILERLFNKD